MNTTDFIRYAESMLNPETTIWDTHGVDWIDEMIDTGQLRAVYERQRAAFERDMQMRNFEHQRDLQRAHHRVQRQRAAFERALQAAPQPRRATSGIASMIEYFRWMR